MTTRKRAAIVILALLLALTGASVWSVYGVWRQAQRNADLIAAIKRGDPGAVETLLENGADPNTKDTTDRRTSWQRVRALFLHGTAPRKGLPAFEVAERYLHYDATDWKESEPMLSALIKHGADPNVQDNWGMTPLMWACRYKDEPLVQVALAHGAKVNMRDVDNYTPLMAAAESGDGEIVQTLLEHGADVNYARSLGDTALICAICAHAPSPDVVKMLLEHGAQVMVKDVLGNTPVKLARQHHRPDLVSLLKQYGAQE